MRGCRGEIDLRRLPLLLTLRFGALGIVIALVITDLATHSIVRPALWVTAAMALLAALMAVISHLKGRDTEVSQLFALAPYRAFWTLLLAFSYAVPVLGDIDDPVFICFSILLGFSMVQDGIVLKGDPLARRIKTFLQRPVLRKGLNIWVFIFISLLFIEVGLRVGLAVYGTVRPMPIWLTFSEDYSKYKLSASRYPGHKLNPDGFNDEPFQEEKHPGTPRVIAVGDSFLVGLVPRERNFIDIMERRIQSDHPVEIYNMGINHTHPGQYLAVLVNEGLRWNPDVILIGLFVGNDIKVNAPENSFWYRRSIRTITIPRRILALSSELAQRQNKNVPLGWAFGDPGYLDDPEKEFPTFSEMKYLKKQRKHLKLALRQPRWETEKRWRGTLENLAGIHEVAKERGIPMLLVIMPDEFQVNESVRKKVFERFQLTPEDYDVASPQKRLVAFARSREIAVVDLLEPLREADKVQRCYHLQDGHWNSRGNAIAAEAILPALRGLLEAQRK
jgi:hypothetical protein